MTLQDTGFTRMSVTHPEIEQNPARSATRSRSFVRNLCLRLSRRQVWPPRHQVSPRTASRRRVRWKTGAIEGDAPVPHRDVGIVADDEVVQDGDVEETAGRERLRRQVQVVR